MSVNIVPTINYVKFIRGTASAFNKLTNKDDNTLYFICEKGASSGELYLGSKLISGRTSGTDPEIEDVITTNVQDKQILIYDEQKQAWINASINILIDTMIGATETTDGANGLVPKPMAEDRNKVLSGGGKWVEPTSLIKVDSKIFKVSETGELTINPSPSTAKPGDILSIGENQDFTWVTPNYYTKNQIDDLLNNRLTRKKVEKIEDIDLSATDVNNYIYLVPNNNTEGSDIFDEYVVIDGRIERIGSSTIDFDGYVKTEELNKYIPKTDFTPVVNKINELDERISKLDENYISIEKYSSEVGDLNKLIRKVTKEDGELSTLVDEINDINDRLIWHDLIENS